jgi:MerR family transcriptional regulator, copper efflux regulator
VQGETLTVAQAATQLGVNEKTVRRWVKSGRLSAELVPGPYGQQYRISADALQTAQQALAVVTVDRGADPRTLALAVAKALEHRDVALRADLDALRQEIGALSVLLEERLPMPVQGVQSPGHGAQSPIAAPGTAESPDPSTAPSTPQPAPWWRTWWPW